MADATEMESKADDTIKDAEKKAHDLRDAADKQRAADVASKKAEEDAPK